MEKNYTSNYTVLVVDDEESVGKAMGRLFKKHGIDFTFALSGEAALKKIRKAPRPFPVIISDQRMPGMKGYEFLQQTITPLPDATRILMSGYTDLEDFIESVNKAKIHTFIPKPWDSDDLVRTVRESLDRYNLLKENNYLLQKAKEQNHKLYALAKELNEKTKTHKTTMTKLDTDIKALETKIRNSRETRQGLKERAVIEIEKGLTAEQMVSPDNMAAVYQATLQELYEQLNDTAVRNGLEISDLFRERSS